MFTQEIRIVRMEQSTKDRKRTYPRYVAIYDMGDDIGFTDVSLTGDTLATFNQLRGEKTYVDVSLKFGEGKKDQVAEEAFIGNLRKKDENGEYTEIKDKNGEPIPHIVVVKLSEKNVLAEPIKFPQKDDGGTKTSKGTYYKPSEFFHKKETKKATLTNIKDDELPF